MTDVYPKYKVVVGGDGEYEVRKQHYADGNWEWYSDHSFKWAAILYAKRCIAKDARRRNTPVGAVVWGPEP